MLIQVPLFSKSLSQIKRPLPPSDPPTSQDIVHAIVFLEKVKVFFSPPSFKRKLCRDYRVATVDDLAKAQLYLHKVCSAATAGTGGNVESHVISAVEPILRRLDQMNETLVRVVDNSGIHGLERWLDSDSQNHPFNDLQLYDQIPISWDREDKDPEHFELPPLRTNNDFTNLTDYQLDNYIEFMSAIFIVVCLIFIIVYPNRAYVTDAWLNCAGSSSVVRVSAENFKPADEVLSPFKRCLKTSSLVAYLAPSRQMPNALGHNGRVPAPPDALIRPIIEDFVAKGYSNTEIVTRLRKYYNTDMYNVSIDLLKKRRSQWGLKSAR
ncbi:uncharacterized protein HD556DRAFT_1443812 [Suillus plorans]|uniref:Uncharacterized protein n=1 Tax=Suillus plorans TaxID=116603 RepID=A0A9P7DGB1_9AGAM|nr:uncharacterized protein HD556DRAFT_1443812 [Suillus plorans]KAG1793054.1 hypothetical protein HD556DRAFT_1443812 [Suillus plorans]